jgi:hypothetical protein
MEWLRTSAVLLRTKESLMQAPYLRTLAAALELWPADVLAEGADDLALTIEQNLAGIAFRLDLRPEQAAHDLEAQGRQLELLATEAPDHPALPELEQTYATLQADLAAALAGGAGAIPTAPEGFDAGMEDVEALQARAEAEFVGGHPLAVSHCREQRGGGFDQREDHQCHPAGESNALDRSDLGIEPLITQRSVGEVGEKSGDRIG